MRQIDLLIVGRTGKSISGTGMDPNVTGRYSVPGLKGGADARKLVVLDLADESYGNSIGIGLNAPKIPLVMRNDREAIALAIHTCNRRQADGLRIVGIRDTLNLTTVYLSEALWMDVSRRPDLEALDQLSDMEFDSDGRLVCLHS